MIKRASTVLALAAWMGSAACADLTEHPATGVASDFFQSEAGANAATLGTYAFLRALYYSMLVKTWGAVQLNLEPTVGVITNAHRTPADSIYAVAIIPDLQFAIANLPVKQSETFRATKGAAETLLAEVYLTRGAQGDFDAAANLTTPVINSGAYTL